VCAQAGCCRAAQGVAERASRFAQPQRASLPGCGQNIDSLAEGALWALAVDALEPGFDLQCDSLAKARAVSDPVPAAPMDTRTGPGALRTDGLADDTACLYFQAAAAVVVGRDALADSFQRLRESGNDDHGVLACSSQGAFDHAAFPSPVTQSAEDPEN